MLYLVPALFLLAIFGVLIWPTRKGAQLVGAVQTSYVMVIMALFAGVLLSIMVTVPVSLLLALATKVQPPGTLLALLGVLATAFAYSKVLETSLFGGITIYIIQTVALVVFSGLVYLVAMAWVPEMVASQNLSGIEDIRTMELRTASDTVCNCGTDQDCLSRNYRDLRKIASKYEGALLLPAEKVKVEEYTRRAKLCVMQPAAPAAEEAETAAPPAEPAS